MLWRKPSTAQRAGLAPVLAVLAVSLGAGAPGRAAANEITSLSRSHDVEGRTVITVTFSEPVPRELVRRFEIAGPPRAVVAVEGVGRSFEPSELVIGDANVVRARLVHHPDRTPPELLVVLDLTGPDPEIVDLRTGGSRVEITVGPPDADPTPAPTAAPASPTRIPQTTVTLDTTAAVAPTPTPTRTATPTPTATFEPSPTPSPSPTPTPPRTATPRPRITAPVPAAASPPAGTLPPPIATPAPTLETASRIEEITLSNRADGTTLLLVAANGRLPRGCARHMKVAGNEPAIVVTLRGLSAPGLSRTLSFDDRNVRRIRLVHDAGTADGELHLLITPTSAAVEVRRLETAGPNLVVLLSGGGER